ncbi:hypothetical protein QTP81_07590 [Alteromonas sp. ASW11-36]|uniref:Tetratricopeptide repeat protein n=1 Tax=Alteromonas arenosi TaxID=3055817 RepID=A0ABT7SW93_9ALTE|nr:hypothetical protein [Alteromonas sp. ASW11-36]MDM7860455.1 hypothetical protein [Alteromonas sp. ASW11-36]
MQKELEDAVAHLEESQRKAKFAIFFWLAAVAVIAAAFYFAALEYSENKKQLEDVQQLVISMEQNTLALQQETEKLRAETEILKSETKSFRIRTNAVLNDISVLRNSMEALTERTDLTEKALYVAEKWLQKSPLTSEEQRIKETAVSSNEDNSVITLLKGIQYLDKDEYDAAITQFKIAQSEQQTQDLATWGLARTYLDSKQFELALSTFNSAMNSADVSIRFGVLVDRGLTWVRLTEIENNLYNALADYKAAIAIYENELPKDAKYPTVFRRRGLVLLRMGEVKFARRDFDRAVNVSVNDEEIASALENIGLIYLEESSWKQAIENSRFVAEIYPNSTWNWSVRAIAAGKLKNENMRKCSIGQWVDNGGNPDSSMRHYVRQDIWQYLTTLYNTEVANRQAAEGASGSSFCTDDAVAATFGMLN